MQLYFAWYVYNYNRATVGAKDLVVKLLLHSYIKRFYVSLFSPNIKFAKTKAINR